MLHLTDILEISIKVVIHVVMDYIYRRYDR
jgi:hypothetical protein